MSKRHKTIPMCSRVSIAAIALATAQANAQREPRASIGDDEHVAEICSGDRVPFESPAFEHFDTDADQRLTSNEVAVCQALGEVFSRLDPDADGALTRAEYRSFADVWRQRVRTFGADGP